MTPESTRRAVAAWVVDLLPGRLWWPANVYRVFGQEMHLCVGGSADADRSVRTIEIGYREVAKGNQSFLGFSRAPRAAAQDALFFIDVGWYALAGMGFAVILSMWVATRSSAESRRFR
jgi:hypothetical protein